MRVELNLVGFFLIYGAGLLSPRGGMAQSGASSLSHVFRGITIVRVEGLNDRTGETHVKYLSPDMLKEDDRKRAEKYQWTEDRIKAEEANIDRFSPGGVIQVDILRTTAAAANTGNFTVVVLDKEEKEVMRKSLPTESHLSHRLNYYGAMAMCTISKKMEGPFFILLIDNHNKKEFKFKIIP